MWDSAGPQYLLPEHPSDGGSISALDKHSLRILLCGDKPHCPYNSTCAQDRETKGWQGRASASSAGWRKQQALWEVKVLHLRPEHFLGLRHQPIVGAESHVHSSHRPRVSFTRGAEVLATEPQQPSGLPDCPLRHQPAQAGYELQHTQAGTLNFLGWGPLVQVLIHFISFRMATRLLFPYIPELRVEKEMFEFMLP